MLMSKKLVKAKYRLLCLSMLLFGSLATAQSVSKIVSDISLEVQEPIKNTELKINSFHVIGQLYDNGRLRYQVSGHLQSQKQVASGVSQFYKHVDQLDLDARWVRWSTIVNAQKNDVIRKRNGKVLAVIAQKKMIDNQALLTLQLKEKDLTLTMTLQEGRSRGIAVVGLDIHDGISFEVEDPQGKKETVLAKESEGWEVFLEKTKTWTAKLSSPIQFSAKK